MIRPILSEPIPRHHAEADPGQSRSIGCPKCLRVPTESSDIRIEFGLSETPSRQLELLPRRDRRRVNPASMKLEWNEFVHARKDAAARPTHLVNQTNHPAPFQCQWDFGGLRLPVRTSFYMTVSTQRLPSRTRARALLSSWGRGPTSTLPSGSGVTCQAGPPLTLALTEEQSAHPPGNARRTST